MALPLPRVVPDVGIGGGIVTAMRGQNALRRSALENRQKELENQFYGPNIESLIAQRRAMTEGQNISNEFSPDRLKLANDYQRMVNELYRPNIESQIEQRNAQMQQKKVVNELVNNILTGHSNITNPAPYNEQDNINQNIPLSGNIPSRRQYDEVNKQNQIQNISPSSLGFNQLNTNIPNIGQQQNNIPIPSQGQQQPFSNVNYPQAAVLNHLLGLGPPKIIDVNGQKVAVTPFGNVPVAQGLSPSQEAYQKGKGKFSAESYGKDVETYSALQNQSVALDEMISALDNPEFHNVVGPVASFFKNWTGTPAQKQLLGSLQTASGEIALQIAPSLKGAFTGRDQTLINSIKANPKTDFPDVFIGKLKSQKLISEVLKERARLSASYKDQEMSPLQANERAARETPLSKFKPIVDKLIHPKTITIRNQKTGERKKVSIEEARKLGVKI